MIFEESHHAHEGTTLSEIDTAKPVPSFSAKARGPSVKYRMGASSGDYCPTLFKNSFEPTFNTVPKRPLGFHHCHRRISGNSESKRLYLPAPICSGGSITWVIRPSSRARLAVNDSLLPTSTIRITRHRIRFEAKDLTVQAQIPNLPKRRSTNEWHCWRRLRCRNPQQSETPGRHIDHLSHKSQACGHDNHGLCATPVIPSAQLPEGSGFQRPSYWDPQRWALYGSKSPL